MRHSASTLYNLDPVKHRNSPCGPVIHGKSVHAQIDTPGASSRWKSNISSDGSKKLNAFMTYLRNLAAVTSRRHNVAMNDASIIPNFVLLPAKVFKQIITLPCHRLCQSRRPFHPVPNQNGTAAHFAPKPTSFPKFQEREEVKGEENQRREDLYLPSNP